MPRFVILTHDWPVLHWDFLLEAGPVLKAWRLRVEPQLGVALPAEPNFDHRLEYLIYEGPLSGDRGRVWRWDHGTYDGDLTPEWTIQLHGVQLTGSARLRHGDTGWTIEVTTIAED